MRFRGTDVVIYKAILERKQTTIMGTYLLPSTLDHLPYLEEALTRFRDQDTMLIWDLSTNIGNP